MSFSSSLICARIDGSPVSVVSEELETGFKVLVDDVSFVEEDAKKFLAAIDAYPGTYSHIMSSKYETRIDCSTGKKFKLFEVDYFLPEDTEKTPGLVALAAAINSIGTYYDTGLGSLNVKKDNRVNLTPKFG